MAKSLPLPQESRPPCSLSLNDADLKLGNANWMAGLLKMSDWTWSGHLMPQAFPNNLGRYFLHIPAIFEQQLNFSTTLIFDEPSFRNGIQISGFLDRVARELAISLIAQRRHCWYSMTHHAILGWMTAKKHGVPEDVYEKKLVHVTEYTRNRQHYSEVESQVLEFAHFFCTNPKAYSDENYRQLRKALKEDNQRRYKAEGRWMDQLYAARAEQAKALAQGRPFPDANGAAKKSAAAVGKRMSSEENERKVNAQVVELAFLCLQFVALTDVFTGLNIPDEDGVGNTMQDLLPDSVICCLNTLNQQGGNGLPPLVPPPVDLPLGAILKGEVEVEPAPLTGARIPLVSYEPNMAKDRDKGLTVGGVQVGVYGWSFGYHFPGSLVYALMHHPELARYEAPYSLPVLFNEDEWRNDTHTGGYVSRQLKELVFQKIYKTTRSRYGLEHHTMFLYNTYLDLYGVGRPPRPKLSRTEELQARRRALEHAEKVVIHMLDHENAPPGIFTDLEKVVLTWTHRLITRPHSAYEIEPGVRGELDKENRRQAAVGVRRLDTSGGVDEASAYKRLVDHQIAELAMLAGHMDGLGRALTILRLEAEKPVQIIKGKLNPATQGIRPKLNPKGEVVLAGYFNNRPGLLEILPAIGISKRALTLNELVVNPELNEKIKKRLSAGQRAVRISSAQAKKTGEF